MNFLPRSAALHPERAHDGSFQPVRRDNSSLRGRQAPSSEGRPMRVGDFDRFVFVVGAPRCGTTTLFHFLKSHPAVASPVVKEPHFFTQYDLRGASEAELRSQVEGQYLRRFFRSDPSRRVGVDASVTYLYAPEQLEPILRLWPKSRFVIALRDPLTMLPSLHKRLVFNGDETIDRFEEAWAAIPARRVGQRVPRSCVDPRWLYYDEPCRYFTYLQRLFWVVGRERCQMFFLEDLSMTPTLQYLRLAKFVGIEPSSRIDVTPQRESYDARIQWLQRLLKRPPQALRQIFASDQFLQRFRDLDSPKERKGAQTILSLRKRLLEWNQVPRSPQPLPPWLCEEICRRFKPEVEGLEKLLGRDLSHWLRPERPNARSSLVRPPVTTAA